MRAAAATARGAHTATIGTIFASVYGMHQAAQEQARQGVDIDTILPPEKIYKELERDLRGAVLTIHSKEGDTGMTLLHYAAKEGWAGLAQYLVGENVNPCETNNDG